MDIEQQTTKTNTPWLGVGAVLPPSLPRPVASGRYYYCPWVLAGHG